MRSGQQVVKPPGAGQPKWDSSQLQMQVRAAGPWQRCSTSRESLFCARRRPWSGQVVFLWTPRLRPGRTLELHEVRELVRCAPGRPSLTDPPGRRMGYRYSWTRSGVSRNEANYSQRRQRASDVRPRAVGRPPWPATGRCGGERAAGIRDRAPGWFGARWGSQTARDWAETNVVDGGWNLWEQHGSERELYGGWPDLMAASPADGTAPGELVSARGEPGAPETCQRHVKGGQPPSIGLCASPRPTTFA